MVGLTVVAIATTLIAVIAVGACLAVWRRARQQAEARDELEAKLEEVRREARGRIERAKREARRREDRARWEAIEQILPAIDALESAARHEPGGQAAQTPDGAAVSEGLSMTLNKFEAGLESLGIERVHPSPGEPFRAESHEALHVHADETRAAHKDATDPEESEAESGEWLIHECVRSGYRTDDRILRPAGVVVEEAVGLEAPEETDESEQGVDETAEEIRLGVDADEPTDDDGSPRGDRSAQEARPADSREPSS